MACADRTCRSSPSRGRKAEFRHTLKKCEFALPRSTSAWRTHCCHHSFSSWRGQGELGVGRETLSARVVFFWRCFFLRVARFVRRCPKPLAFRHDVQGTAVHIRQNKPFSLGFGFRFSGCSEYVYCFSVVLLNAKCRRQTAVVSMLSCVRLCVRQIQARQGSLTPPYESNWKTS